MSDDIREPYGKRLREIWVKWASDQPDAKPSWVLPWEELDEGQREVDMRMAAALYGWGFAEGMKALGGSDFDREDRPLLTPELVEVADLLWEQAHGAPPLDQDPVSVGAEAISDLLTMLGVDPDERQEHGGPTTAETLAAAVVRIAGPLLCAAELDEWVTEFRKIAGDGAVALQARYMDWVVAELESRAAALREGVRR